MKTLHFSLLAALALLTGCSTSQKTSGIDASELEGTWASISPAEGADTLTFRNDGTYAEAMSHLFRLNDSGFDITYAVAIQIGGTWQLVNDSLYVDYDTTAMALSFSDSLFSIAPSEQGANLEALKQVEEEMKENLYKEVAATLKAAYGRIDSPLGRVTITAGNVLEIENNGATLALSRL